MATPRFDWSALGLLFITVLAFVLGLAGCAPIGDSFAMPGETVVPSELLPFQGTWKLDEAQSPVASGQDASGEEMSADEKAFLDAMKKLGVVMSDIEIRGAQITQQGGFLQAQYDLLDYRSENGRIVGTALWHEDKHDPGDATEIKITLERNGDKLIFTREIDELVDRYQFHR